MGEVRQLLCVNCYYLIHGRYIRTKILVICKEIKLETLKSRRSPFNIDISPHTRMQHIGDRVAVRIRIEGGLFFPRIILQVAEKGETPNEDRIEISAISRPRSLDAGSWDSSVTHLGL